MSAPGDAPAGRRPPSRALAIVVACALAVQFGILAPLAVYASNRTLFEITYGDLLPWSLAAAAALAIVLSLLLVLLRRATLAFAIVVSVAIYLYVQFYVLVWDYGALDGSRIDWSDYTVRAGLEIAVLVVLVVLAILRRDVLLHIGTRLLVAAVAVQAVVLVVSSVTAADTGGAEPQRRAGRARELETIDELSAERNVILLIVDTLQGDYLERFAREEKDIASALDGFRVFTNASGLFPYTSLSVPGIQTGRVYSVDEEIGRYRAETNKLRLSRLLRDAGYETSGLQLNSRAEYLSPGRTQTLQVAQAWDVALFRQAPHVLKPAVLNDYRFLLGPQVGKRVDVPSTDVELDTAVIRKMTTGARVADAEPRFKLVHLWGAHPPTRTSGDCSIQPPPKDFIGSRESYASQARCVLRQVAAYLDRLKELGVYDDSMIVITGDHGSKQGLLERVDATDDIPEVVMSAAHPGIAIKGLGAKGSVRFSKAPVSLADIHPTILEHLGIRGPEGGVDMLAGDVPSDRLRRFVWYDDPQDAREGRLPSSMHLDIVGDVRDPGAWTLVEERGDG